MTYYEILFVLALKTISKGNVKASAYGTNVILDKVFILNTTQSQNHHLFKKSPFLLEIQQNWRKHATL